MKSKPEITASKCIMIVVIDGLASVAAAYGLARRARGATPVGVGSHAIDASAAVPAFFAGVGAGALTATAVSIGISIARSRSSSGPGVTGGRLRRTPLHPRPTPQAPTGGARTSASEHVATQIAEGQRCDPGT